MNKKKNEIIKMFFSFLPHREVTKQANLHDKTHHQSLPSLNAPRKKPNFSCCNWSNSSLCIWLKVNTTQHWWEKDHKWEKWDVMSAAMGTNHHGEQPKQLNAWLKWANQWNELPGEEPHWLRVFHMIQGDLNMALATKQSFDLHFNHTLKSLFCYTYLLFIV